MRDVVDRLTPLGVMVLALLREGDMHPYEMIRLMRMRHHDRLVSVTHGSVYHTVARLERLGLLAEVGIDREGRRPERTTYALTDAGSEAVVEWVRRELPRVDRPEEFRIALSEAHNLERDEAVALLRARRDALAASHRDLAAGLGHARAKSVPEQYLLEAERGAAMTAAELAWLDDALERLDRPDFDRGAPDVPSERYLHQREAARR